MNWVTVWRYYQGVVAVLVFGLAVVANIVLPFYLGWLVGFSKIGTEPRLGVTVGIVAVLITLPGTVWLMTQLPDIWRSMAWTPERRMAWRRAHDG
jgi:hypothetical protein